LHRYRRPSTSNPNDSLALIILHRAAEETSFGGFRLFSAHWGELVEVKVET
jgi:hypothetical protein